MHAHIDLCNNIFLHLIESTDFEYHRALGRAILKLLDALYVELKKGGQEAFKKKVLFKKIPYIISLLL